MNFFFLRISLLHIGDRLNISDLIDDLIRFYVVWKANKPKDTKGKDKPAKDSGGGGKQKRKVTSWINYSSENRNTFGFNSENFYLFVCFRNGRKVRPETSWTTWSCSIRPRTTSSSRKCRPTSSSPHQSSPSVLRWEAR